MQHADTGYANNIPKGHIALQVTFVLLDDIWQPMGTFNEEMIHGIYCVLKQKFETDNKEPINGK